MDIRSSFSSKPSLTLSIFLLAMAPLFTSCSSVEGVRVSNATTDEISVKAFFKSPRNESVHESDIENSENNVSFSLDAGSSDLWQYEAKGKSRDTIDQTFLLLVIENHKGCSTKFDRKEIEEKATKNGMWNLVINTAELNCP